jgi:hypothetical protein
MVLVSFGLLSVYSYTRADGRTYVSAAVPARLNFQARLLQSNGAIVADGNYSVEFNLYTASSGGSSVWSETHATVAVRAGYLSVYLGDVDNDLDTLDWSQQYWLTMNVNGDGEMNPRLRLTSVPYAFRASQADGITNGAGILEADDIAQLAPSSVQAVNTALAALRINQQGAGLLAQLQGAGSDVFTIANNGDVVSSGDATFSGGTLNLGAATQAGGLVLSDGSNHTGTIQTTALGQNTTYSLPDPGGGSATICLSTGNCIGGGDISNGGNSFTGTITIGTNDPHPLAFETGGTTQITIDTSGNFDVTNGALEIGSTSVISSARVLQNVTADTGILTSGTLATSRGGTGLSSFTTNGVLYASSTSALTQATGTAGQVLLSGGGNVPTFTSLTGDISITSGGLTTIANDAVTTAKILDGNVTNAKLQNNSLTINTSGNIVGGTVSLGGNLTIGTTDAVTFNTSVTTPILTSAAGLSVTSGGSGALTLTSGSGIVVLGSNTLQNNSAGLSIDVNNAGLSTLSILNNNGSNVANLDVEGAIFAGNGNAFQVNSDGDITSAFTALDGTSTTNGTSGGDTSISLVLNDATSFDVGNYVQMNSTNCGGAGINVCYTKITDKAANTLTISPSLVWGNGAAVSEYHIPEIGGNNTSQPVASRYGRAYFISGVVTGNGSTYYNGHDITTTHSSFNLLNVGVTTLNIGGDTSTINMGNSGTLVNILGSLQTAAAETITAGGGLIVSSGGAIISGGIDNNSGGLTETGAVSGVTTLVASGAITAAISSNTINGLVINAGTLSSVTGITFSSGSLDLANGGITNTGSIAGATTIGLSGAITGATATDTINGLVINSGALSAITGFTQTSGNFAISGTGTFSTGTGAVSLNGNTSLSNGHTFTVGTGTTSLGGALNVTGLATLNGSLTLETGDTLTINGEGLTDLSGNGLAITANTLTISLQTGSGMTVSASGLSNRRDCSNNQILKWANGGGGAWNCAADGVSDSRLKQNVATVEGDLLDRIQQVRIVDFDYDCNHPAFQIMHCDIEHQTGVIAQELAQIFPELVVEVNGYYQVRYDALSLYSLKATQELARKVYAIEPTASSAATTDDIKTGGVLRLDKQGALQNITGLAMISGGASVVGGINNNYGGLTNTGAILGGTVIEGQSLTLNAQGTGDILALKKDGTGVFTIFNTGALEMKLDSENAFAVKTSGGSTYFNVNTIRAMVSIGSIVPDEKAVLFTLDAKDSIEDPEGVNGASYFNSKLQRFRCYQEDRWTDCLPVGTLNDPITLDRTDWGSQPSVDTEFPGTPRILPNYSMAHEFRLRMRVTNPGSVGASCRLQFAQTDDGPWTDLAEGSSGELKIDASGTLATDWLKIKEEARDEVVVRIMCKGGNGLASPTFYGVSVQLR